MKYIIRFAVTLGLGALTSLAQQQSGGQGRPARRPTRNETSACATGNEGLGR